MGHRNRIKRYDMSDKDLQLIHDEGDQLNQDDSSEEHQMNLDEGQQGKLDEGQKSNQVDSGPIHFADVHNLAFADALAKAKPSPWTRTMFKLYFFCFVATLNSCINGYDGSLMGSINAMPSYQKFFGMTTTGTSTGIIFSIYTIGNIVGSFFCGPLTDRWGRRWGMIIGACTIITGTCIQAPSINEGMFLGGRFILGFGVAICATAGPSYVAEMAHPAWRGPITAVYNTFWFVGAIPASYITYGTNKSFPDSNLAWRLPIWLQMTFSGFVVIGSIFAPETPRWLFSHDKKEAAHAVLTKYHGEGDPNNPIVQVELDEMTAEINREGSDKRWWDYRELFNSREAWWRQSCVIGMAFFGQWAGNGAVSYFMPVMLKQAGINDPNRQLSLNAGTTVLNLAGALFGSQLVDRVGRRPMLITASALFCLWFSIIAALSAVYAKPAGYTGAFNTTASNATIAMIYLFGLTFAIGFTPLQALYPVECLRFETRAKGMGMYNLFVNIAGFFNLFVTPIALGKIGYKLYFMYIGWDAFQTLYIYFMFVETKNRTLEEVNSIFKSKYPRNASFKRTRVVISDSGERGVKEVLDD